MTKTRSPRYPAIGLREAIEKARLIYEKDYQNKVPKKVIAEHMGYNSLNGKSLGVLAALARYGLIEGRGEETGISDLALAIIAHEHGTPERIAAIRESASKPELFSELDARFRGGQASDSAIRSYLLTQKYIPEAADNVVRSYRETKDLVSEETSGYDSPTDEERSAVAHQSPVIAKVSAPLPTPKLGLERAEFPLPEGVVRVEFPADLSPESYEEFKVWFDLVLRRVKRGIKTQIGD